MKSVKQGDLARWSLTFSFVFQFAVMIFPNYLSQNDNLFSWNNGQTVSTIFWTISSFGGKNYITPFYHLISPGVRGEGDHKGWLCMCVRVWDGVGIVDVCVCVCVCVWGGGGERDP